MQTIDRWSCGSCGGKHKEEDLVTKTEHQSSEAWGTVESTYIEYYVCPECYGDDLELVTSCA